MSNDPVADPFGELLLYPHRLSCHVLGARCDFRSNSSSLIALAKAAFSRLPRHRLFSTTPRASVTLRLEPGESLGSVREPPPLRTYAGEGLVYGVMDAANHAIVCPAQMSALVVISRGMLRFPYHARYELIEFAVYVLATRALRLIPVHAAGVSRRGHGLLLVGNSGAGKSTLTLHAMLGGLTLLSEDCVFVEARTWLASAVPTFLHLRNSSVRTLKDGKLAGALRRAPIIRRRSRVEKYEIDLRTGSWPIARTATRITSIVFLSTERGTNGKLLQRLPQRRLRSMLIATQPYAARLDGWSVFLKRACASQAYILRRGSSPTASIEALRALL
jgi:hypothetical protein